MRSPIEDEEGEEGEEACTRAHEQRARWRGRAGGDDGAAATPTGGTAEDEARRANVSPDEIGMRAELCGRTRVEPGGTGGSRRAASFVNVRRRAWCGGVGDAMYESVLRQSDLDAERRMRACFDVSLARGAEAVATAVRALLTRRGRAFDHATLGVATGADPDLADDAVSACV